MLTCTTATVESFDRTIPRLLSVPAGPAGGRVRGMGLSQPVLVRVLTVCCLSLLCAVLTALLVGEERIPLLTSLETEPSNAVVCRVDGEDLTVVGNVYQKVGERRRC